MHNHGNRSESFRRRRDEDDDQETTPIGSLSPCRNADRSQQSSPRMDRLSNNDQRHSQPRMRSRTPAPKQKNSDSCFLQQPVIIQRSRSWGAVDRLGVSDRHLSPASSSLQCGGACRRPRSFEHMETLEAQEKIYKAKAQAKTVTAVDGCLYIDYKYAGLLPPGFRV